MDVTWWPWVLAVVGVGALYFVGRKDWRGWAVGLAVQLLWVVYTIMTKHWSLLFAAGAYGAVYYVNLWRWTHSDRAAPVATPATEPPARPAP